MSWDPKLLHRHLKTRRFGREVIHFDEINSTNQWMMEHHEQFTLTGAVAVADHQTGGRGRQDRTWVDVPQEGLLFSILLRLSGAEAELTLLSFLPAIALGEYLREYAGESVIALKWPNDVLMNGKKIAGVLGQIGAGGVSRAVVLGMGVNVLGRSEDWPEAVGQQASTIEAEGGGTLRREILLAEVLNLMEPMCDGLLRGDLDAIRSRWLQLGPPLGVEVTRREGTSVYRGAFAGLGPRGELLLRGADGSVRQLYSGDVGFE